MLAFGVVPGTQQKLQTCELTSWDGLGVPTAQLAGSAAGMGDKESAQVLRALVTGLASKLGVFHVETGAPVVRRAATPPSLISI